MSFFALTPNRHVYAFLTTFFCILQVYRHFDENNDYFLKSFFAFCKFCGIFMRKVPNSKACIRTPVCDFGLVLPGGAPVNKNPVCTFVANMLHLITKNAGIFSNQN